MPSTSASPLQPYSLPPSQASTISNSEPKIGIKCKVFHTNIRMGNLPANGQLLAKPDDGAMPIAIVGIGCRFPGGASTPEAFWENIVNKKSARKETPPDRFNIDAFYHPHSDKNGTLNCRAGHYLDEDMSAFDAPFFSISPAEARSMDPMQRMLLEVVYEATESAGMPIESLAGTETGCFVGCFTTDYDQIAKRDPELLAKYHSIGTGPSILSNRLSYVFDLKGPSFTLDTACSSSLVAVHLACQSIRAGESKMAIVGATQAILNPDTMIGMSNLHFLSPDARCHAFDSRANGYARGEGMAALILKPLHDAIRDGDTIRSVVRGTAVNSNGKGPGITVPSRESQVALIRTAYEQANCDPALTQYCEAHGTGTPVGDPLEAGAIGDVFGSSRKSGEEGRLFVGSVKTNIGHLEGASGLAGIIKAVMSLEKGLIAPNIWFEKGNPDIDFNGLRIRIPTEVTPWPTSGLRRASVNGFGYGGTNGHVVLDDAYHFMRDRGLCGNHRTSVSHTNGIVGSSTQQERQFRIFQLSARESSSVMESAKSLAAYVESLQPGGEDWMEDLAFTLSQRRSRLEFANAVVASTAAELVTGLRDIKTGERLTEEIKLNFIFTGQGAQWFAMGRELLQYPVFRRTLEACDAFIKAFGSSWSILVEMCKNKDTSRINEPEISQPLCTALQLALLALYASWNVYPSRVVGHSSGEIAAAYAIGVLTLNEAMAVAYFRGLLSSKVATLGYTGGMMAVGLSEKEALGEIEALGPDVGAIGVACINSPKNVTLSGDVAVLDKLQTSLVARRVFARKLQVSTAYHSSHMLVIADEYERSISNIGTKVSETKTDVTMFSSVTGRAVTSSYMLGAEYWVKNMVSCVRFSDALAEVCKASGPNDVLVELGPHAALSGPAKHIMTGLVEESEPQNKWTSLRYHSALIRGQSASFTALSVAASLASLGYPASLVCANNIDASANQSRLVISDLPTYRWNRTRKYWDESRLSRDYRFRQFARADLLGAPAFDWNPMEPRWRNFIRLSEQPWVRSHTVQGSIVYPATGYCCMAFEAAAQLHALAAKTANARVSEFGIRSLAISRALVIPETEDGIEVIFSMQLKQGDNATALTKGVGFRIFSYTTKDGWAEHCQGVVFAKPKEDKKFAGTRHEAHSQVFRAISTKCDMAISQAEVYPHLDKLGLSYGPDFQGIIEVAAGANEACGVVQITDTAREMPMGFQFPHLVHPSTLDACMQMSILAVSKGELKGLKQPFVPTWIEQISISGRISSATGYKLQLAAKAKQHGFRDISADVIAVSQDGSAEPLIQCSGIKLSALGIPPTGNDESTIPSHTSVVIWEPDVDSPSCEQMNSILRDAVPSIRSRPEDFELLAYFFFRQVLDEIKPSEVAGMHPHHQKFFKYMQHQHDLVMKGDHELQTPDWTRIDAPKVRARLEALIKELNVRSNVEGQMFVRMGQALVSVLRKEVEPLALMTKDDLLDQYYSVTVAMDGTYPQVARYISLLSHKNPDLAYLEIGAGTGGCTRPILEALQGTDGRKYPRMKSYTYTDISSNFFEAAADKFKAWGDQITYAKLDIEQDPWGQAGFETDRFDVIVACNVLHATYDIDRTMAHVRKLLKPSGKLIVLDMTHSVPSLSLIFGNLPGWWNCKEPFRQYGPLLDEAQWRQTLIANSFTDFQGNSPDTVDVLEEQTRIMIASAIEPAHLANGHHSLSHVILIAPDDATVSSPSDMMKTTSSELEEYGVSSSICTLKGTRGRELSNTAIISFAELDSAVLASISEEDYMTLQRIVSESAGILWITRGSVATKGSRPELSLFHGLARSLRAEREDVPCVTLDFDVENQLAEDKAAGLLMKVFRKSFHIEKQAPLTRPDREFSESGGLLRIKRVVESSRLNQLISRKARSTVVTSELQEVWQSSRPLRVRILPGSEIVLDDDTRVSASPLHDEEVQIEVRAVGLNQSDVRVYNGEVDDELIGSECAGVITQIGSGVSNVALGDRVVAWRPGSLCTTVRCDASFVRKVPENIPLPTAATIPVAYCTALYCIDHAARVRSGDEVLIHHASSFIGQACLQVAMLRGAQLLATVGSEKEKLKLIVDHGLEASHVFVEDDAVGAAIKIMTGGARGVDTIINTRTGASLDAVLDALSPFARVVEIRNSKSNQTNSVVLPDNASFTTVDASAILLTNAKLAADIFGKAISVGIDSCLKDNRFIRSRPLSSISESLRSLKNDMSVDKIVLEVRPKDLVPVLPKRLEEVTFQADASYLLSGGLGGIGRSISRWMASKGARNLIYVSRRGATTPEAITLIGSLNSMGVRIEVIQCDIADEEKFRVALTDALNSMPPLRGVIQGAMSLQDQIFTNMTHAAYMACVRPKVHGSWTLHQATLGLNLDFFVMLASCTSFWGNAGQSNYAAGCTYQGSLAAHRRALGLAATSIDVGKVANIGFIAENAGTQSDLNLVKLGLVEQNEIEVLTLLELAMLPASYDAQQPGHGGYMPNGHLLTGQSSSCDTGNGEELPFWSRDPVYSHMDFVRPHLKAKKRNTADDTATEVQVPLPVLLKSAVSASEAALHVVTALQKKMARALMMPAEDVDVEKQMAAYGVDSLIAVDLRNWFLRETGVDVSTFDIVQAPSLTALAGKVAVRSTLVKITA
ncbi:hypothetical protein PWT90_02938 [Aphanocladium album]|nr:hypothetical protein PWT90_02938 [Aphanocladium album]